MPRIAEVPSGELKNFMALKSCKQAIGGFLFRVRVWCAERQAL
jgi:hypothetical protein